MLHYGDEALKKHAKELEEYEKKYPNESRKTNLTQEEIEMFELQRKVFPEGISYAERLRILKELRKAPAPKKTHQSPAIIKIPARHKIEYQLIEQIDNYWETYYKASSTQLPWFRVEWKNDKKKKKKIRAYLPIYIKKITIRNFNQTQWLK